jgi:hypothetical protein
MKSDQIQVLEHTCQLCWGIHVSSVGAMPTRAAFGMCLSVQVPNAMVAWGTWLLMILLRRSYGEIQVHALDVILVLGNGLYLS